MTVHGAAHYHIVTDFIEKQMLFEGTKDDEEPPVAEAWISEAAARPELRVLSKQ
jgi:hypothetical protein